ncbi:MAG: hypothetical protein ACRETQ_05985 [Gammaproteobacteria bacterium]
MLYKSSASTTSGPKALESYPTVKFINASSQPISALTFTLSGYKGTVPVASAKNVKPFTVRLTSIEPFAAGSSHRANADMSISGGVSTADIYGACMHLTAIHGRYQDGSAFTVHAQNVDEYSTPQVRSGSGFCDFFWYQ